MPERGYAVDNIQPDSLIAAEITLRAYQMSVGGQEKKGYSIRLNGVYYQTLISESRKLKVVTTWLMKTGLLSQFNLITQQLQE